MIDLEKATHQELFDIIATHLLKQNKKSMVYDPKDNGDICAYRGTDGAMCAIGPLLSDEQAQEGLRIKMILYKYYPNISAQKANFLDKAQMIHDNHRPEDWPNELRMFATSRGLKYDHLGL